MARDLTTGEVTWRAPVPLEGRLVTLADGTVVLIGSDEIAALRP
ncbi:hypothetical protein [Cellulomonas sp. ATA003]|nr:hypothetical protein [Cellulomonas sp. ATA003]WNB84788.1 hypothetical protein REH70_13620 [Cellulomonas sp. ATA003]